MKSSKPAGKSGTTKTPQGQSAQQKPGQSASQTDKSSPGIKAPGHNK